MDIRSSTAVASIALKLTINTRNEIVLTTLPVADLSLVSAQTRMIFPQIAFGGVYSTRLIFISNRLGVDRKNQFHKVRRRGHAGPDGRGNREPVLVPAFSRWRAAILPRQCSPSGKHHRGQSA
jgi:hypothetical protein